MRLGCLDGGGFPIRRKVESRGWIAYLYRREKLPLPQRFAQIESGRQFQGIAEVSYSYGLRDVLRGSVIVRASRSKIAFFFLSEFLQSL